MSGRFYGRRDFAKKVIQTGAVAATIQFSGILGRPDSLPSGESYRGNLKISLNAYSFDKPLRAGTMTLDDLLDYCAQTGFDGVDLTGYYFPGYPEVPEDEYIYHIRKKAFRLGIDLGCTGVRNDFTWADRQKREEEKKLVKEWTVVAHKLGAPGLRIFAGTLSKENFSWEERAAWIAEDIRECAEYAGKYGVMLALQNHNDFIKDSSHVERILSLIDSEWVGLMLDIGSYHTADPYKDIAATARHAITWQMKEQVFINENQVDTDYRRVVDIVLQCGYKGYLPLETLGEGDPYIKAGRLFKIVQSVLIS